MKCPDIRKLLSGYIDGDLGDKENSAVMEHLKSCNNCARELELLKETVSLLKAKRPVEPPPDFVVQVRRKIEARRWWKEAVNIIFLPLHIKIPAEAIATVVIVCLLYYIYHEPIPMKPQKIIEEAPVEDLGYTKTPSIERLMEKQREFASGRGIEYDKEIEVRPEARGERRMEELERKSIAADYYRPTARLTKAEDVIGIEQAVPSFADEAAEEIIPEQIELLLTLKRPRKDSLRIKKYISLLNAKQIIEEVDELSGERIINFQIGRKGYLRLAQKLIQIDAIEPQEIKEPAGEEDILVKLRIRVTAQVGQKFNHRGH